MREAQPQPRLATPPVARGLPILGNYFDYRRRPIDFLLDSAAAYGPVFRMRVLGVPTTVVCGEQGEALVRGAAASLSRHRIFDAFDSELGLEIFGVQGEEHMQRRRLVKMGYSRMVAAQFLPEMAQCLSAHLARLKAGKIRLLEVASQLVTLAAATMLTPRDPGPGLLADVERFGTTVIGVVVRLRPPLMLRAPGYRGARRRLEKALDAALDRHRAGAFVADRRMYMADAFLAAEVDGMRLGHRQARGACLYALAGMHAYAGRVTAYMVYEMLRNPALLEAARAEADAFWSAGLDPSLIRRLTMLRAAFHEALRMYPLLAGLPFRAGAELEIGGYRVPKDEMILVSGIPGHFFARGYDNPHAFDAGRCAAPRNEHRCPGAYSPFGVAPRVCAAGGMVEVVTLLTVVTLLRAWNLELVRPSYRLELVMRPLLSPADGLPVVLESLRSGHPAADASLLLLREAPDDLLAEEWQELPMPRLEPVQVAAGTELVTEGEAAQHFFIILAGEASIWRQGEDGVARRIERLEEGQSFGEIGLLKGVPRNATVRAETAMRVLRLDRETFMSLVGDSDLLGAELGQALQQRFVKAALATALPQLAAAQIAGAAPDAEVLHLEPGEVVFREGEAANCLYIVLAGYVDVLRQGTGGVLTRLNRLGPGEAFGEIGILERRPRTATVRAAEAELVELLCVERRQLEEMIADSPAARGDLALLMSRHLMNEIEQRGRS